MKDKIYQMLFDLRGEFRLEEKVKPENRESFTETVKEFIRFDFGRSRGFYIEFSNDYLKLKKYDY